MGEAPIFEIRKSSIDDVHQLEKFISPFVDSEYLLPRSTDELSVLVQNGFIAEREGRIVGFSAVEIYSRKLAEIQCLAVTPECQGQGVGRRLVELCVAHAFANGVHELMAITSSERIFNECGFHYSLPNQKRALFIHPGEARSGAESGNIRVQIDDLE